MARRSPSGRRRSCRLQIDRRVAVAVDLDRVVDTVCGRGRGHEGQGLAIDGRGYRPAAKAFDSEAAVPSPTLSLVAPARAPAVTTPAGAVAVPVISSLASAVPLRQVGGRTGRSAQVDDRIAVRIAVDVAGGTCRQRCRSRSSNPARRGIDRAATYGRRPTAKVIDLPLKVIDFAALIRALASPAVAGTVRPRGLRSRRVDGRSRSKCRPRHRASRLITAALVPPADRSTDVEERGRAGVGRCREVGRGSASDHDGLNVRLGGVADRVCNA